MSRLLVAAALSLFCVGCASDAVPERPAAVVVGTVTLDGVPLPSGMVVFSSAAGSTSGQVADGKFAIPRAEGLAPGDYAVSVTAYRKTGRKVSGPGPDGQTDETVQFVPPQYNVKTTLKQTLTLGDNSCAFELKSR